MSLRRKYKKRPVSKPKKKSSKICPFCGRTHVPNKETRKVLRDSRRGINVQVFTSKEELFKDLGL